MSANDPDIPTEPADGGGSGGEDDMQQKMLQFVVVPYGINAFSLFYYFTSSPSSLLILAPLGLLNLGAFLMATYTIVTGRFPDE